MFGLFCCCWLELSGSSLAFALGFLLPFHSFLRESSDRTWAMRRNMDVPCSLGFHRRSLGGFDVQKFSTIQIEIGQDFPNDAEVGQKMQVGCHKIVASATGKPNMSEWKWLQTAATARCGR